MESHVLDLGSMAVLMGTVALGLEKVRMKDESLSADVKALQKRISDEIVKFDVKISEEIAGSKQRKIHPLCSNRQFHYLLRVTRNPECENYPFKRRCAYKVKPSYWSAVLLNVMRSSWHALILFLLATLSIVCFLFQKAGEVYKFDHIPLIWGITLWPLQDVCLYAIYIVTIIATLAFAIVAHMLASVEPRCDRYINELKKLRAEIDERDRQRMMRGLAAYTGTTAAAPTPR